MIALGERLSNFQIHKLRIFAKPSEKCCQIVVFLVIFSVLILLLRFSDLNLKKTKPIEDWKILTNASKHRKNTNFLEKLSRTSKKKTDDL